MGALTCWLLDTRSLWPGESIAKAAPDALSLISQKEAEDCKRKYHLADAKMSLASALLKRLYISKTLGIPWSDVRFGRKRDPTHGKPCALLPDGTEAPIEFNISHQAGLVALVGCDNTDVELGIDIVCVNERNDYRMIDKEGLDGWVDVYTDIFSTEESWDMKYNTDPFKLLDGTVVTQQDIGRYDRCCRRDQTLVATLPNGQTRKFSSDLLVDAKLRRFYTYWCYKEAYIKLDGEALLAKWIKELEFRNVRAPVAGTEARCSTKGCWGEKVTDAEVWLRRERLADVKLEIQAFEEKYMISVAAKPKAGKEVGELPDIESLHLEADVMEFARASVAGAEVSTG